MAGENEVAQGNTEATTGDTQTVDTTGAGGNTLLTTEGKQGEGTTTQDAAAGDGKVEGDGKASDKVADTNADGKPIEYTAFDLPEGITLDEAALGKFTPIAQELKLDQIQAQKLVSVYAEMQAESGKAFADQVAKWGEDARNDAEIGGAKFIENVGTAITGLKAFGSPELTTLLNETGLGNHPEMLRFCHRVGLALQEDKTLAPGSASGAKVSPAAKLFDHPTSQT